MSFETQASSSSTQYSRVVAPVGQRQESATVGTGDSSAPSEVPFSLFSSALTPLESAAARSIGVSVYSRDFFDHVAFPTFPEPGADDYLEDSGQPSLFSIFECSVVPQGSATAQVSGSRPSRFTVIDEPLDGATTSSSQPLSGSASPAHGVKPVAAGRRPTGPMTYDRAREVAGQLALPPGFPGVDVTGGASFHAEVQRQFDAHLHENDTTCAFFERRGAFGYREVFHGCMSVLFRFDPDMMNYMHPGAVSREMESFLRRNTEEVNEELNRLSRSQNGQIITFRQVLVDFAHLKQAASDGGEVDQKKIRGLLATLRQLQRELNEASGVIQGSKLNLQSVMMIRDDLRHGRECTEPLMDVSGRRFPLTCAPQKRVAAYQCALNFYDAYSDEIIDSNFQYCNKFLGSIQRCKNCITEFQSAIDAFQRASRARPPALSFPGASFMERLGTGI